MELGGSMPNQSSYNNIAFHLRLVISKGLTRVGKRLKLKKLHLKQEFILSFSGLKKYQVCSHLIYFFENPLDSISDIVV